VVLSGGPAQRIGGYGLDEGVAREALQSILGLAILRVVLVCHVLTVFAQSVFAGQFLSGSDSPVKFHELTGWIVLLISAIQILLAAVLMRSAVTSLWLVLVSIFLFLCEGLQIGTGYGRVLNVHVPLGVIIVAAVSCQTISAFLKPARPAVPGNEV
jgi:hypothetical protein